MMSGLIKRTEDAARPAQRRRLAQLAEQLESLLGEEAVKIEEGRVLIAGRGVMKRWLVDPALRFLSGALT